MKPATKMSGAMLVFAVAAFLLLLHEAAGAIAPLLSGMISNANMGTGLRIKENCHPRATTNELSCRVSGDPHYYTFDCLMITFQGICTYLLAEPCSRDRADPDWFRVAVKNQHLRPRGRASWVQRVIVDIGNTRIMMEEDRILRIADERTTLLPLGSKPTPNSELLQSGHYTELSTTFGLRVRYDNMSRKAEIILPDTYQGQTCGLCGDADGDARNDRKLKTGQESASAADIANSYQLAEFGNCENDTDFEPACDADEMEQIEARDMCGMITDTQGPFASFATHDLAQLSFGSCLFDLCAEKIFCKDLGCPLCDALEGFVDDLNANGQTVAQWRRADLCPLTCPADSTFKPSTSACAATCTDPTAPDACVEQVVEGCECDEGFILSGDTCIRREECGCLDQETGIYHEKQTSWLNSDCSKISTCTGGNEITSEHYACSGECQDNGDGERVCSCTDQPDEDCGGIYDCDTAPSHKEITCENETPMSLACPAGERIHLVNANFGRTVPYAELCPYHGRALEKTDCVDATSINKVKAFCGGRQVCEIPANRHVFGDPCLDVYKYLEVNYQCVKEHCEEAHPCETYYMVNPSTGDPYTCDSTSNTGCPFGSDCSMMGLKTFCCSKEHRQLRCHASGDPHYTTFDGALIHFQGRCSYILAESTGTSGNLEEFHVYVKNENRQGRTRVSWTQYVEVEVAGDVVRLDRGKAVEVNSQPATLPYVRTSYGVELKDNYVILSTGFGLHVAFDGNHAVELHVPKEYAGSLSGICGDGDGDLSNDMKTRDGEVSESYSEVGESYTITRPGDQPCQEEETVENPVIPDTVKNDLLSKDKCGMMSDLDGYFRDCIPHVSNTNFIEECIYDAFEMETYTLNPDDPICDILLDYEASCAAYGVYVYEVCGRPDAN